MVMARGASGPDVVTLQQRLTALGWPGVTADGKFGLVTDCAVRRQQRLMRLSPDGVVGPATEAALAKATPLTQGNPIQTRLPVRYRSQRDNAHAPSSTCNVTSYAMVLNSIFGVPDPAGEQLEDSLYELINSPAGVAYAKQNFPWAVGTTALVTVHGMLVWAAAQHAVRAVFATTRSWSSIVYELTHGRPVVLAGKFTASGHIVVLSGLADPATFIVQDPWGDWNRGYREVDGSSRVYTQESLSQIVGADGSIWAHFFP